MQNTFTPAWGVVFSLLLSTVVLHAQDGTVDASFGTGGKVIKLSSLYPGSSASPALIPRILVQPDGKILHISPTSSTGLLITRYLPDGALDVSFGSSGSVVTNDAQGVYQPRDAYMLPDGKFLVVGESGVNTWGAEQGFAVLRYNGDGTLDNTFNGDGKTVAPMATTTLMAYGVAVQPDGKIVVGGTSGGQFAVVRFMPDGSLDPAFSSDGITLIPFENGATGGDIAIQPDGKIVIGGSTTTSYTFGPQVLYSKDIAVARLLADGAPDNTFDGDGKQVVVYTGSSLYPVHEVTQTIALQPDGKILVGGYTWQEGIEGTYVQVTRFTNEGTVDAGFNTPKINIGGENYPTDMALQEDGKILVGGYTKCAYCSTNDYVVFVVRLLPGGAYDNSFDADGKVILRVLSSSKDWGGSLAQQGTKLLVGGLSSTGGTNNSAVVYRLNNSSPLLPRSPVLFYRDQDGDGYGSSSQTQVAYAAPAGYVAKGGDCNDGDVAIHPGATELADGKDNDCDGVVDNGFTYTTIPARIEAEAYASQNGTQLESTSDAGGGQNVGYIDQGDYLEYNIAAPSAGAYTLNARVASQMGGGTFEVRNTTGQVLTSFTVPNTGGWQNWTTLSASVTLPQGNQILRLVSTSSTNWNINWTEFTQGSNPPPTYITIPTKIEAEAYTAQSGTQLENTSDAGGGQNVGYIEQGDWMEYNISATTAGTYTLNVRVASQMSGGSFEVRSSTGQVLASYAVPNTGSWQNWTTVTATVTLPAGNQTVRLVSTSAANWNSNWLEFTQVTTPPVTYVPIPAKIEAESYSAQSGTQVEGTSDAGGGQNVGYIEQGDWMAYNISVPSSGTYTLNVRVASQMSGGSFEVRNAWGQVLASFTVPNTGSWQTWATLNASVSLPQGDQTIRLVSTSASNWNINWLEFVAPTPPSTYVTIPDKIEAEAYAAQSGTQLEGTSDAGGGQNVGYIEQGDWMEYNIAAPSAGQYTLMVRVASQMSGGSFEVRSSTGQVLASFTIPNTGSWQTWTTLAAGISLPQGNQTIRLVSTSVANWNINWLEFAFMTPPSIDISFESLATLSSDQCPYSDVPVRAVIRNTGATTIDFAATNLSVRVEITGAGRQTLTGVVTSGLLAPNATEIIDVWPRANLSAGGNYIFNGTATLAGDTNPANNDAVFTKTIVPVTTTPWYEGFDSPSAPTGWDISGWSISTVHGEYSYGLSANLREFVPIRLFRTLSIGPVYGGGGSVLLLDYRILNTQNYPFGGSPGGNWGNFKVQISTDCGANFVDIATETAANSMWVNREYDLSPFAGQNVTVRIVANWASGDYFIDFDNFAIRGAWDYTRGPNGITTTDGDSTLHNSLNVYPNPAGSSLTLQVNNQYRGLMNIDVLDLGGRLQKRFSIAKPGASKTATLPLEGLSTGVYLLRIQMEGWTETRKIIKE